MALGQNYGINADSVADQIFTEESSFKRLFNTAKSKWIDASTVRVYTNETSALVTYDETSLTPLSAVGGKVLHRNNFVDYTVSHNQGQARYVQNLLQEQNPAATIAEIQKNVLLEQAIPAYDQYGYGRLVALATNTPVTWTAGSATLNARNAVMSSRVVLRNKRVPMNTLVGICTEDFLVDALVTMGTASDTGYGNQVKGKMPTIGGIPFITVSDDDLPGTTKAVIASTQSVIAPVLVSKVRVNNTPDAFDGTELLFHNVDDTFVYSQKAGGIVIINAV